MRKSILLIDNEEVFHWITKKFLDGINIEVKTFSCHNGQEGLDFLTTSEELPDIVLLDLNMPIANGWVFLDNYLEVERENLADTRVYVVSSSIDPEDVKKAKDYTFVDDYIPKRISLELLQVLLSL